MNQSNPCPPKDKDAPDLLNNPNGLQFFFLGPLQRRRLEHLREQVLRFGPGVYLRRAGQVDDEQLITNGLEPAPLPLTLWDLQAQVGLYTLIARHQAQVMIFDLLNQALPWLEQRPNSELADIARFLIQLHQRTNCTLICIYQHNLWVSPEQRRRIEKKLRAISD